MHENAIPARESLTIEFKSDLDRLPDRELVAATVCLANTEGGQIYLGVEDDGTVTGLHPEHQSLTGLAVLIANKTVPSLSVRVTALKVQEHNVAVIEVPRSDRPVATSDGLLQRRRLLADGRPECGPFFPHEWDRRASDLGQKKFKPSPHEPEILKYLQAHGRITRREVIDLCRITPEKATWLLGQLVKAGKLSKRGSGRSVFYVRGRKLKRETEV